MRDQTRETSRETRKLRWRQSPPSLSVPASSTSLDDKEIIVKRCQFGPIRPRWILAASTMLQVRKEITSPLMLTPSLRSMPSNLHGKPTHHGDLHDL